MKTIYVLTLMLLCNVMTVTAQEKKAGKIVTDYFAWLDAGNLDQIGIILTEDFVATAPFSPKPFTKMEWKSVGQGFVAAFPGMKHAITNWFADDNNVVVQGTFTGTNKGSLMGNPPTNNRVSIPYTSVFELNGKGLIKRLDVLFDNKSFESQLMAGIPMAGQRNEKTVRELFVLMDAGETEKFSEYCSQDFMISNPFLPAPSPIEAFKGILASQKTAFPDMKHQVLTMSSNDKYVTSYGLFTGTNTGSMMGNPPTGNKVKVAYIVMDEFDAAGKLKFRNVQFDSKSFESQLMAGINPNATTEKNFRDMMEAVDNADVNKFESYWVDNKAKSYFNGVENSMEEVKARVIGFKKGFPDIKRNLKDVIVNSNTVTIRGVLTGTNKGSFMGKPATNNKIEITWLALYKLNSQGKIETGWVEFDSVLLEKQLEKKSSKKK